MFLDFIEEIYIIFYYRHYYIKIYKDLSISDRTIIKQEFI